MKRRKLFILPLLILGMSLAACVTEEVPATAEDAINATKNLPTLVLRPDGSSATLGKTYSVALGDKFYVLDKYVYEDFEVTVDWTSDNASNVTFKSVATIGTLAVENRLEVSFKVGVVAADDYLATISGTLSCEGAESVGINFKASVTHVVSKETTILELKEGYKDANYNMTLPDEDVVFKSSTLISFYAYVVGHHEENSSHLYSGIWVQDGDYGVQIYAGKLDTLWFANEIAIGDLVHVIGYGSGYGPGLLEVKPSVLDKAVASEHPTIELPEEMVFEDADNWNSTWLTHKDSNLIEFKNLVYKSGTASTVGSHWTIKFEGTKSDGTTKVEIPLYVNYHIGTTAQTAIKTLMTDWVAGTTTVTIKGAVSWYGTPQLVVIFLEDLTPVECITVL